MILEDQFPSHITFEQYINKEKNIDQIPKMKEESKTGKFNKARQFLIDSYIHALSENQIPWVKGWKADQNQNAISKHVYKGMNAFILNIAQEINGYKDPRWCTFKQATKKNWKIKKGSKGIPVEFWAFYHNKKAYTAEEVKKMMEENPDLSAHDFKLRSRISYVFNMEQMENVQEKDLYVLPKQDTQFRDNEFIENVIHKMNVGYREGGANAYYSPKRDEVTIPPKETFYSEYAYNSTRLHELCHATGHPSRLNRDMVHPFGSLEYAKEELRAEISASFLMQDCQLDWDSHHIDNHKAYIQSWIKVLKEEPQELFKAIHDATTIADYVKDIGQFQEYVKTADPQEKQQGVHIVVSTDNHEVQNVKKKEKPQILSQPEQKKQTKTHANNQTKKPKSRDIER